MIDLHVPTLAMTLVGVCSLFFASYAYFGMRRRWSAGSAWWSASTGASICATFLLFDGNQVLSLRYDIGLLFLHANSALLMCGLRAHLKQPLTVIGVAVLALLYISGLIASHTLETANPLAVTIAGYSLSVVFSSGWSAFDIWRHHRMQESERLYFLFYMSVLEALGTAMLFGWMLYKSNDPSVAWFPSMVAAFLLIMSLRYAYYFLVELWSLENSNELGQQAVLAGRRQLRELIHNLGAGVLLLDGAGRVQMLNRAGEDFFRSFAALELNKPLPIKDWHFYDLLSMRQPVPDLFSTLGPPRDEARVDSVFGLGPVSSTEALKWGQFNSFYLDHGYLDPYRVITFVDITPLHDSQNEQKALQTKLAEGQRMRAMGTLAGGIAHDFNNILTAILGSAQVMQRHLEADAVRLGQAEWLQEQRESAESIAVAARRGRELVRQILSYGRRRPLQRQHCNPGDLVREVMTLLRVQQPAGSQLRATVAEDLPELWVDPTQLAQALLNLGTNAIHALRPGQGAVDVLVDQLPIDDPQVPRDWAAQQGDDVGTVVRFQVVDTGSGMPAQTLERMYEPFFSTKPHSEGTGLGLAVVQGVVHAHGGAITVDSEVGRGSSFSLFLPPAVRTTTLFRTPSPAPTPGLGRAAYQRRHVVLVEDDPSVARAAQRVLQQAGHICEIYIDPLQALTRLERSRHLPDLVTVDYRMSHMDGFALATRLRQAHPHLPMVMISAYVERWFESRAQSLGLLGVWLKSDCVETLDQWIEAVLTSNSSAKQALQNASQRL